MPRGAPRAHDVDGRCAVGTKAKIGPHVNGTDLKVWSEDPLEKPMWSRAASSRVNGTIATPAPADARARTRSAIEVSLGGGMGAHYLVGIGVEGDGDHREPPFTGVALCALEQVEVAAVHSVKGADRDDAGGRCAWNGVDTHTQGLRTCRKIHDEIAGELAGGRHGGSRLAPGNRRRTRGTARARG